jgi:hypothetical protein
MPLESCYPYPDTPVFGIASFRITPPFTYGSCDLNLRAVLFAIDELADLIFESAVTLGRIIWC